MVLSLKISTDYSDTWWWEDSWLPHSSSCPGCSQTQAQTLSRYSPSQLGSNSFSLSTSRPMLLTGFWKGNPETHFQQDFAHLENQVTANTFTCIYRKPNHCMCSDKKHKCWPSSSNHRLRTRPQVGLGFTFLWFFFSFMMSVKNN